MAYVTGEVEERNEGVLPFDDYPSGSTIGNYLVGSELGRGSYGIVKLGTHKVSKQKVIDLFF